MTRQFSGLSMERQLWYANEYAKRIGGKVDLGRFVGDSVRVVRIPPSSEMDAETLAALETLDSECHEEWVERAGGTR